MKKSIQTQIVNDGENLFDLIEVDSQNDDQLEGQLRFSDEAMNLEDRLRFSDEVLNVERQPLMTEFFIPMKKIPSVTAQQHRAISQGKGKKVLFIDTPELATARLTYVALLSRYKPDQPATGPIRLKVYWCYKETKKHPSGTWKTSRPDTDNLQKLFKDCMTKTGFWKDDAQVVEETIGKGYERYEGIYVKVEELTEGSGPA